MREHRDDVPVLDAIWHDGPPRADRVPLASAVRRQPARRVRRSGWPALRLQEIAAAGGGIWASVQSDPRAADDQLLDGLRARLRTDPCRRRHHARGQVRLRPDRGQRAAPARAARRAAARSRRDGARDLVSGRARRPGRPRRRRVHQRGARDAPARRGSGASRRFTTSPASAACSRPAQAARLLRALARARDSNQGVTPTRGRAPRAGEPRSPAAPCRPSTSPTRPTSEIREVGATDTIAVLLPQAELVYMTERRANARLLIEQEVPVAIATDYCSSIHATSLPTTIGIAAPWFSLTPGRDDRRRDAQRGVRARVAARPRIDRCRQARRPHAPVGRASRRALPRGRPADRGGRDHRRERVARHGLTETPSTPERQP